MDNNKDFDELLYLLDKYKDKITIKVNHYIQGNTMVDRTSWFHYTKQRIYQQTGKAWLWTKEMR